MAALAFILAMVVIMLTMDMSLIPSSPSVTIIPRNASTTDAVQMSSTTTALAPGELPGYTGWARPEETLAGFFTIVSISTQQPRVGEEFSIRLWCHRNEECAKGRSLFYLRAYGPSVIPGVVKNEGRGKYAAAFTFPDPGVYTVEIVLTFSSPPSMDDFPLAEGENEPAYEGYLLPGFPLQVSVEDSNNQHASSAEALALCTIDQLLETSASSAASKARWRVKRKSNAPDHIVSSRDITKSGYLRNFNSLGIQMEYEYISGCSLLPQTDFEERLGVKHPFSKCGGRNMQVIFIGDSVMRVQKEMFDSLVERLPNIQTSYVSLYGGYRRVQSLEPAFKIKLEDIQRRAKDKIKVVLFNTGLHDIHRLCGEEWRDDRYKYLDKEMLDSGSFSCTKEYKSVVEDFALMMQNFEADLKVFQSTSAAWPKYGNFGLEWPFGGQVMPVTTDVVPSFNEIAVDILRMKFSDFIKIIDGFWISYARPDNREIGTIGNKLSHPGLEVQSAMVRIWAMVILEAVCDSS